jgi:2-polyprenyl-3-methyl-5-hydroxy-6-metoxy-1,4-benzoquinol methylase
MNDGSDLFHILERINARPEVYSRYTADALWNSPDISEMMLRFHLDGDVDLASRRTSFIETSLAWISATFRLGEGTRVVDLGCGPGLYAHELAKTGARVTGVDFSERSIDHARSRADAAGLEIDYVFADYLDWQPQGRFDLATMIMCDFCALSPAQRAALLTRVQGMLEPGGAFLFDVYSVAYYATWEEQVAYGPGLMDGFWSAGPYYGFLNTLKYDADKVVLEKYTIVEETSVSEYLNWFQHYDVAALTAEVEAAGLVLDRVVGDVAGEAFDESDPEFAVIARKPGGEAGLAKDPSER